MSDYKLYTGFTEAREGGLSKDKNDSASKFPVPDGSGYHTNKGITWEAFTRLSHDLGYSPTPDNFYNMPDEIFNKIFEHYWNKSGANLIENQAIANIVFQALWGGGHSRLVKDIQKLVGYKSKQVDGDLGKWTATSINLTKDKKELYEKIHQKRLDYLRSLKVYVKFGKGWEKRMKKLYDFNQQYL
jgi:lysozyme family protein